MSEQVMNPSEENKDLLLIDDAVIEKISGIAAREVKGILGMKGSLMSGFASSFGASGSPTQGVTASVEGEFVTIEIKVILEYGASAPEVFEQVKRIVREQIKNMTGLVVRDLQLRVVDVMTRAEYDRDKKEGAAKKEQQTGVNVIPQK